MTEPIDKYLITAAADGGKKRKFSRVFWGLEKTNGRKVVLKTLAKTAGNQHLQERLLSEARFSFTGKGLPEILDLFETENEIFLVKAYQEGVPLNDFMLHVKQKDKPAVLLELLKQLLPILAVLNERKILHLDLKPGNILVSRETGNLSVELIDFGMAVFKQEENDRKTLFPLGYAAPELILNRLYLADRRTDLFALGVTLWQCFTGNMPLLHPNPSITTNLQITHPLPAHDRIPPSFHTLLERMCHKHIFRKPPNAYVEADLDQLLLEGMNGRFAQLDEVIAAWEKALSAKPKRLQWLKRLNR